MEITQEAISKDIKALWPLASKYQGTFSKDVVENLKRGLDSGRSLIGGYVDILDRWDISYKEPLAKSIILCALVGQKQQDPSAIKFIEATARLAENEGLSTRAQLDTLSASAIIILPGKNLTGPFEEEAYKVRRAFPLMEKCEVGADDRVRVGEIVFAHDISNSSAILREEYTPKAGEDTHCKAVINDAVGLSRIKFDQENLDLNGFSPITKAGKKVIEDLEEQQRQYIDSLNPWNTMEI